MCRTMTKTVAITEFETPEEDILCALYATIDATGAKLRRVHVTLRTSSARHPDRLRVLFVRGNLLVVQARAANSRDAIRAASQLLKDALSKRLGSGKAAERGAGRTLLSRTCGVEAPPA